MSGAIVANRRTVAAIRKADALPDVANRRGISRIFGSQSGASDYSGYFTVIQSGTGKIKVINGADETATVCGSFTAGTSNISCTATELSVSGSGVVYLRIYYTTSYQYAFGFAATLPSAQHEIYIALASVNASGTPAQVWTGGAMTDLNGSYWL